MKKGVFFITGKNWKNLKLKIQLNVQNFFFVVFLELELYKNYKWLQVHIQACDTHLDTQILNIIEMQPDASYFKFPLVSSLFPTCSCLNPTCTLAVFGTSAPFLSPHAMVPVYLCVLVAAWCAHQNKAPPLPVWILSQVEDSAPTYWRAINNRNTKYVWHPTCRTLKVHF